MAKLAIFFIVSVSIGFNGVGQLLIVYINSLATQQK